MRRRNGRIGVDYDRFSQQVQRRLADGAAQYGNRSLRRPPAQLASEIQEELADVAGWSALLWTRINRIGEAVATDDEPDGQGADEGGAITVASVPLTGGSSTVTVAGGAVLLETYTAGACVHGRISLTPSQAQELAQGLAAGSGLAAVASDTTAGGKDGEPWPR